jgi:hypothetical protein
MVNEGVFYLLIKGGNDWVVSYTARPYEPCQGLFLTTQTLPRKHENLRRTRKKRFLPLRTQKSQRDCHYEEHRDVVIWDVVKFEIATLPVVVRNDG